MRSVKLLLLVVMSTFSIASCALNMDDVKPDPKPDSEVFITLQDGVIYAIDANGDKVPLKKIKLPFKHDITEVESVETITILKLKGSQIELICTPFYCFMY